MIMIEITEYVVKNVDKIRSELEKRHGCSFAPHTISDLISIMVDDLLSKSDSK